MSSQRRVVQVSVTLSFLIFIGGIWLVDKDFQAWWLRLYSVAVLVAIVGFALWDRLLWRWPWLQRWKWAPRDLRGTWRGELTTLWQDPDGEGRPAKAAFLVIRQTATNISAVLLTDASRSKSTMARLSDDDGSAALTYLYFAEPKARHFPENQPHHGVAILDVVGRPPSKLTGRYWTARESRGELVFEERVREQAEDFAGAAPLFGVSEPSEERLGAPFESQEDQSN